MCSSDLARWEVRSFFGAEPVIYDKKTGLPLDKTDPEAKRFVVHVDPLRTEPVNGDPEGLNFVLRKLSGSLQPFVKRQYLDKDFVKVPQRAVLLGGPKIDLNRIDKPEQYSDDPRCGYFDDQDPHTSDFGRTYVAAGETFDFDKFKGGELIIEDYKGETVPTGTYQMAFWEPNYERHDVEVAVRDRDQAKPAQTTLVRETLPLDLEATGPRPANRGILEGRETHHRIEFPLDFKNPKQQAGLPVDVYVASTNVSGLDGWQHGFDLFPPTELAPIFDTASEKDKLKLIPAADEHPTLPPPPVVRVKTRLGLAGRLSVFSRPPDPLAADVFIDDDLLTILNLLLYGQEERSEEERYERRSIFKRASKTAQDVGSSMVKTQAQTVLPPPPPTAQSAMDRLLSQYQVQPGKPKPPIEEARKAPEPPRIPHERDALRKLLAQHLEVIDLLVLDPRDMAQLRRSREVSAIIDRYVRAGGALFAFVTETGEYRDVVGAPLNVSEGRKTKRFGVSAGDVRNAVPTFKKKVKVKSRRVLPEIENEPPDHSWRVIAFTQGRKDPRLIERGKKAEGGYVALWLDDPASYYGPFGGTVTEVEETRGKIEDRVLDWARSLMKRRFDKTAEEAHPAAASLPN